MRLAAFIRSNEGAIVAAWEEFAQSYLPAAAHMDRVALRDHIVGLLRFIAEDLESPQTERERGEKAKGQGPKDGGADDSAAETHADLRFTGGFDTVEMVSEFRALRASVTKLWRAAWDEPAEIIPDLLRFNESIDQVMTESLSRYTEKLNYAGKLFVGTLESDFRDSLLKVSNSARALADQTLDRRQTQLISSIETAASKMDLMVADLIDAVDIRIGEGVLIKLAPFNLAVAVTDAVKRVSEQHPERNINVKTVGDFNGEWDNARFGQLLSILIVSSMQCGSSGSKITVVVESSNQEVILSVQSDGTISPDTVATVFDPLNRERNESIVQSAKTRLNLDLFIARGIVAAYGGKITATSNEMQGTIFTANLPVRR